VPWGPHPDEGDPSGEGLSYWERVEGARSQYFFVPGLEPRGGASLASQ
jgi:hypothetical protein